MLNDLDYPFAIGLIWTLVNIGGSLLFLWVILKLAKVKNFTFKSTLLLWFWTGLVSIPISLVAGLIAYLAPESYRDVIANLLLAIGVYFPFKSTIHSYFNTDAKQSIIIYIIFTVTTLAFSLLTSAALAIFVLGIPLDKMGL